MNWYEHHLGDWLKKTGHLTLAEEGAYRRLVDWYYINERPLPVSIDECNLIVHATNAADRKAVMRILTAFFEPLADGWHQSRCDRNIARVARGRPKSEVRRLAQAERQTRFRERRKAMFQALGEVGVVPAWNASTEDLEGLCVTAGVRVTVTAPETHNGDAHVTHNGHDSRNYQYYQDYQDKGREGAPLVAGSAASAASPLVARALAVCSAIRAQGLDEVRPADPVLLLLLEAGIDEDTFRLTAAEAKARSKGWPWLMQTVKGRFEDGPGRPLEGPGAASPGWHALLSHPPSSDGLGLGQPPTVPDNPGPPMAEP